ncbi:hypothetical protein BT63DRAFT_422769, partial [Microthyrium microscopicum]
MPVTLNYDVLSIIFAHILPQDLARLALHSQCFAQAAQEQLYRRIRIHFAPFDLLAQTLAGSTKIRGLVRHLDISLRDVDTATSRRLHAMFLMLDSIESIRVVIEACNSGSEEGSDSAYPYLVSILKHREHIRKIQFHWRVTSAPPISKPLFEDSFDACSVESLELESHISLDAFHNLLKPLKSLASLTCTVPGTPGPRTRPAMTDVLSPRQIATSLESTTLTLKELKLSGPLQYWPRTDGTRLNLTSFKLLKRVDVPHFLFFNSPGPSPDRDGLYKLLPPSVEHIEVFLSLRFTLSRRH